MSTIPNNTTSDAKQFSVDVSRASDLDPQARRWTRAEYHRLGEQGFFRDQRVELVNGEILVMSPQSFSHAWSVDYLHEKLKELFGDGYWVRGQLPVVHGERSEPEPDVSVIRGSRADHTEHPHSAVLAVEVSKTTLDFDTGKKSHLYAAAGVPDYWVLDLENRQLLVFRQPIADEQVDLGHRYQSVETIAADGHVSPLEKPTAKLAVADMLPPVKK